MQIRLILLLTILLSFSTVSLASSDEDKCSLYYKKEGNLQKAHNYKPCLDAANAGSTSAQYYVGLGYATEDFNMSIKYMQLSANNGNVSAYLGLGHLLRKSDPWKAIYWYQNYFYAKPAGYQLAAISISDIFKELGDEEQARYWLLKCEKAAGQWCYSKKASE